MTVRPRPLTHSERPALRIATSQATICNPVRLTTYVKHVAGISVDAARSHIGERPSAAIRPDTSTSLHRGRAKECGTPDARAVFEHEPHEMQGEDWC